MGESAFAHILGRGWRGLAEGWNTDNPIGLNPETWRDLQAAGLFRRPGERYNLLKGLNEIIIGGVAVPLDLAAKASAAAYRGVGDAAIAAGVPRDIVALPEAFIGGLGGLGGISQAGRATRTLQRARHDSRQFRPGRDGSVDLGWITPPIEQASKGRFPQGPIRMQEGIPGPTGHGAAHISPDKHKRAQKLGYGDGFDLIEDVAKHHDVVVEQVNGRLMLVKTAGQNRYAIAEYQNGGWRRLIGAGDPYYGVTTGFPDRPNAIGKPHRSEIEKILRRPGNTKIWER